MNGKSTGRVPVTTANGLTTMFLGEKKKRTSKTALLNDKFSRAVFLLVLFIFPPRDIIFAFQAIVAGMGPVEFPFKILFPGDLPGV